MFFEWAWGVRSEDGYIEPRGCPGATIPESLPQEEGFYDGDMADFCRGYEGCYKLVSIYGTRNLTKPSDKLQALSGVAQRYEAMLEDECIVGLKKSRWIEDLQWSSEEWFIPMDYECRAPSWPCMSIDGPIHIPDLKKKNLGEKCATVLDCRLELKGQNLYRELTGGWLKLEAPLAEVVDGRIFCFEEWEGCLSVYVEVPHETFYRLQVFALILYTTGDVAWTALLVTPVEVSGLEGERCYRRVGKATNLLWKNGVLF